MNTVELNLNDRLKGILLLDQLDYVLKNCDENKPEGIDKTNYLYNTYNTFYQLSQLLTHNYTLEELIIIANYCYLQRDNLMSIFNIFYYFGVEYNYNLNTLDNSLVINITHANTENTELLSKLIDKLIKELIIIKTSDIIYSNIIISFSYENKISVNIKTRMINNNY